MTSSPASSSALRTVFSAAPAPTVMMTWPAVYGSPVAAVRRLATASRTRTWPAFGMYACRCGAVLSSTRRAAASTAGGGSISGLPSVKSKTLSAPRSALSRAPSSNMRRIQDALARLSVTARETIMASLYPSQPELVSPVAADDVARRGLLERRRLGPAHLDRVRAAGMEVAARRRRRGIRHLARQHDALAARPRIRLGHRGQERRRVRVLGRGEDLLGLAELDDAADVHHRDTVTDVADDAQVVRDEEIGQSELLLQVEQEVQDLRLHGDVQGRDRLVRDDEPRLECQRPRDADALPLAAAECVREAAHVLGPESHPAQEIRHTLLALAPALHAVDQERLADQIEQGHARVERREWILEDHLHLAPDRAQLGLAERGEVDHRAVRQPHGDLAAGRIDRSEDAPRRGGLAAAALTDQAQGLALVDVKVDAVDRAHVAHRPLQEALADGKELSQPRDTQQRGVGGGAPGLSDGAHS